MSVRSRLPRAAVVSAALAGALLPSTAHAVPPYVVQGAGQISPGLGVTPQAQSFWFVGTATTVPLANHPCSFSGTAIAGGGGSMTGTMSGWCGPTQYASCVFTLTLTSWTFACTNGSVGTFSVQSINVNPTTSFSATGTIS